MKRIYSNYSDEDCKLISREAQKLGFSLSAYQHYCVMLSLDSKKNTFPINELISKMFQVLEEVKPDRQFIVSALLDKEWSSLSRSEKMIMAKQLSAKIRSDPRFKVVSATKGKITIYKRIS